jgi:hypothetical protein
MPARAELCDVGEMGWHVRVGISVPFLGEFVRYEGWIEPE